jgi:hypothetical protein
MTVRRSAFLDAIRAEVSAKWLKAGSTPLSLSRTWTLVVAGPRCGTPPADPSGHHLSPGQVAAVAAGILQGRQPTSGHKASQGKLVIKDKRFSAPAWAANPMAAFSAAAYLLNSQAHFDGQAGRRR